MEKEATEQEILNTVKSLPNYKTPGEDGLPSEFYFLDRYKKSAIKFFQIFIWNWPTLNNTKRGLLCLTPYPTWLIRTKQDF